MKWDELWVSGQSDRRRWVLTLFQPYSILPALQHGLHSLTHVRLVFHCEALCHSDSDFILKDALLADLRPASFDFAAVASAVLDEIPSLQYCFMTVGAWIGKGCPHLLVERWCESRAWRIVHCEDPEDPRGTGRRELVELHKDVAETIIVKEDLGVSSKSHHCRSCRFECELTAYFYATDLYWDRWGAFGGMYG